MITRNASRANVVHAVMSKWSDGWGVEETGVLREYTQWLESDEVKKDNDGNIIPKPSMDDVNTEIARLQAEYNALAYSRNRQSEYPTIEELTVALYDTDDKAALETKRAAVKTKWPKNNTGPV